MKRLLQEMQCAEGTLVVAPIQLKLSRKKSLVFQKKHNSLTARRLIGTPFTVDQARSNNNYYNYYYNYYNNSSSSSSTA